MKTQPLEDCCLMCWHYHADKDKSGYCTGKKQMVAGLDSPCEKYRNCWPEGETCPVCGSPIQDNGFCSDLGDNNCQFTKG